MGITRREVPVKVSVKGYKRALPTFIVLYKKYKDTAGVVFSLRENNTDFALPHVILDENRIVDKKAFDNLPNTNYSKIRANDGIRYERTEKADLEEIQRRKEEIERRGVFIADTQKFLEKRSLEHKSETLTPPPNTTKQTPTTILTELIGDYIEQKKTLTSAELFKIADQAFNGTMAEGAYSVKDAYDAMELAVNQRIAAHPEWYDPNTGDPVFAVKALKDLVGRLPPQTRRTAEMDTKQQFSTPPPFAFVANWVAGLQKNYVYIEPSAGDGGLTVFAENVPVNTIVLNELSDRRADLLAELMPEAQIFRENAAQLHNILPADIKPTVAVMNPPFSASATMNGKKVTQEAATHIEQALKRLEPGVRLVVITGRGLGMKTPAFRNW